jgi:N-acetylglucosamine kinase-like BadF-type ATPase
MAGKVKQGEMMAENGFASGTGYFLGFDGGGTKTECVLADGTGRILARATAGPSNPLRIGYTRAWFSLSEALDLVLSHEKITANHISGVCAGLGGAGRPGVARRVENFFQRSLPNADVEVTTDLDIALEAAFDSGEGIILVAGTGSAAFGRDANGRTARAGGRGPWFSDEGSAFDIGRNAVRAVLLAEENRGPSTTLSAKLFPLLQAQTWDSVLDQVSKDPDKVFPKVFPLVAELADDGDAVSRELLFAAAASLGSLAESVAEQLGARDRQARLAKLGGAHGRSKYFDAAVDAELRRVLPQLKLVELTKSPAEAAVAMAVHASRARGDAATAL